MDKYLQFPKKWKPAPDEHGITCKINSHDFIEKNFFFFFKNPLISNYPLRIEPSKREQK